MSKVKQKIKKICPCGKEFEVQPCFERRKFCSRVCMGKYRDMSWVKITNITRICQCGKEFRVYPYEQDIRISCSRQCAGRFMKRKTGYKSPKRSESKMGSKNPNYGKIKENPSYEALHHYIHKRLDPIKPKYCEHCRLEKKLELANKSHEYKRDITDWLWLCKKCHVRYDDNLKYLDLGRTGPGIRHQKKCLNCENIIKNITPCNLERKKYCSRKCLMLDMWKNNKINHI